MFLFTYLLVYFVGGYIHAHVYCKFYSLLVLRGLTLFCAGCYHLQYKCLHFGGLVQFIGLVVLESPTFWWSLIFGNMNIVIIALDPY